MNPADFTGLATAAFGSTTFALLGEGPKIDFSGQLLEYTASGAENSPGGVLIAHRAAISCVTADVATALALLNQFTPGEDVFAASRCRQLTFSGSGITLTFARAWLLPELECVLGGRACHLTLHFRAENPSGSLFALA